MVSDSIVNQRQRNSCNMWEKLAAMNATKTELREYNNYLAIIITVDTLRSSAGRAYFEVVNYQAFAHDHREGPFGDSVSQTDNLNKFYTACLCRLIINNA